MIKVTDNMWHYVHSLKNRSLGAAILALISFLLALALMGLAINSSRNADSIEGRLCTTTQSLLCTDFNPCTTDTITPISCTDFDNGLSSCVRYKCTHEPVSNGTCCSQQDTCYLEDPNKFCLYGTCVSANPYLCKGYCNSSDYTPGSCITIPTVSEVSLQTGSTCVFNSCVTQIAVIFVDVTDPFALLDVHTGNLTNLNITSCLNAECTYDNLNDFSVCTYTFKCALYVDFTSSSINKRYLENRRRVTAQTNINNNNNRKRSINSVPFFTLDNWTIIQFAQPNNMFGDTYESYNQLLNEHARELANNVFASTDPSLFIPLTDSPTVSPTSTPTVAPTSTPTVAPTSSPTVSPTPNPTAEITNEPTPEI